MPMERYDADQKAAIEAFGGHYLVLAPPGCGKTEILSERVVHARTCGVDLSDMLCLTFTNRASRGMRDRIRQKIGEDADAIFIGNVHRFCSSFIYNNALVPANSAIIDDEEMADVLLEFNSDYFTNTNRDVDKNKVAMVDNIDAYLQQRCLCQPQTAYFVPEHYDSYYQRAVSAQFDPANLASDDIMHYVLLFQQYKRSHNLISFSDILIIAYEALRNDTEHRFRRYRWVEVDEVQDLNALQTAIIDELCDTSDDLTVMYLGDQQQAIFSFLGAKLGQLELLRNRCKGHVMTLATNYRSPQYMLNLLNQYAEHELGVAHDLLPHSNNNRPPEKNDLLLVAN